MFSKTLLVPLFASVLAAQFGANWTLQIPQNYPTPRSEHALAFDSARGQVVLFGGTDGAYFNDTWVWDGTNWTQKSPENSPAARALAAMAFDAAHGEVVLFGGESQVNKSGVLNDTWVWDGTNWTQRSPVNSPPARRGHMMAYDSVHGQVVLFGGDGSATNSLFNDTWVWDGTNWTQKDTPTGPPPRMASAMAFDSVRNEIVMFGGYNFTTDNLNDTWVWDGDKWTEKSPASSPSGRYFHSLVFDSAHGQAVFFGGYVYDDTYGFVPKNDTWLWDGTDWTEQSPANSPTLRERQAMAYDSTHGVGVLNGGVSYGSEFGSYLGDTWTWNGGALPVSIASVVSAGAFGGFSAVTSGTFAEIYGSNLAPDTRGWTGSDFTNGVAPTSLDGVQVTIAGLPAFVNYIDANPGQVNVLLPANIPTGTQPVVVTNQSGASQPFNIMVNATEPGLLAPSSFKIGGNQYIAAFFSDGTYVLPERAIAGVSSRPAKPGETIITYGIGFGPVTPAIPVGTLSTKANQLTLPFEISFGSTPAHLAYYGLAPGMVGLYQFDIVVPSVADDDAEPLKFTLGGVPGAQTLYTAVHH